MTASKMHSPLLAVVVTVLNEGENILPVCKEIRAALAGLPATEVIFVDDGSTDDTRRKLLQARADILPGLRILAHPRCLGKSTALRTAIRAARAPWIATMDGDGQDDPAFIKTMFAAAQSYEEHLLETAGPPSGSKAAATHDPASDKAGQSGQPRPDETPSTRLTDSFPSQAPSSVRGGTEGCPAGPLVVGIRRKRQDRLSRKLATRFANGLRRRLLKDDCPDTGAPLKLFRRDLFLALPQFEGVHRFIPALMKHYGAPLLLVETRHRARLHGQSKYTNLNRALVGIRDLLGVLWLQNRTRRLPPSCEL